MKFLSDIDVEQGADATFVDNAKALFGTGNDLQIYHDASNSYIDQTGTGKIILNTSSTGINVQSGTGETRFTKSGADSEILIDDSSQVNKVVLKANGDSYLIGGDVGIGTTGIDSILHIKDTGKAVTLTIESDANMLGAVSFISPTSTDGSISMDSDGDFRISNSANTGFLLTGDTAPLLGLGVNNTSPTQQLHLNGNIRVEGAFYDSSGASGSPGTSGQVLSSTGSGTAWVAASGGGGGIGGSIAATQVAYGDTTSNEITGDSTFFYDVLNGLTIGDAAINGTNAILNLNKGPAGQARINLKSEGVTALTMQLDGSEDAYVTAVNNLILDCGSTDDITMASSSSSGVGIGTTTPSKKLQVNGTIYSQQASGEVMIAGSNSFSTKYITIREGSNYAARWGLQATNDIITDGVMLMASAKPMVFRASTNYAFGPDIDFSHLIIRPVIDGSGGINGLANVGVGTDDPQSKLQVAGGIQMANDTETSTTNSDKAGTLRYREVTNIGTPKASNSYIDMYMRTEDGTYEWVNIVTNNW